MPLVINSNQPQKYTKSEKRNNFLYITEYGFQVCRIINNCKREMGTLFNVLCHK